MSRIRCLIVTASLAATALGVGLSGVAAEEASGTKKVYTPIAPAADLAKVQAECMADLTKLTKTKPAKRRVWSKIRHRAWGVAEMANLLSLHKDPGGDLPKRAGAVAQAAAALGKIAKKRQYDSVPTKVKTLAEMVQAVGKLARDGKAEAIRKPGFAPVAPVIEVMELNQQHYDEVTELVDGKPADDKVYAKVTHRGWILAESGNLLLLAHLDKADWQQWAAEMRDLGKQLVTQAKQKDLAAIRKTVKAMDVNCTACHDEYQ